jgi:hypothetical protein
VLVATAFAVATSTASATSVLTATAPSNAPAEGGVGVRLMDAPTATRDDPRTRQYIVDHLAPGSLIQRRIEVSNSTSGPLHVAVYPAAATIKDGSFTGAAGHTANELSLWTTLSQDTVDLAPGAKAPVTVTVKVAADAPPGEQYAAIWAEISGPPGSGVNLVNRVGIRMYLSVGPGNPPAADFTVDSLTAQRAPDRHPVVTAQVHNTGGRAVDLSGTLSLSGGPGALSAGPFPVQLGSTLAPGQSTAVTVSLNQQLPDGPWDADLKLKSGLIEKNVQARIQFPPDPGAAAPVVPVVPQKDLPWVLLGGLALLAALTIAAGVFVIRRRRRRQEPAQQAA